MTHPAEVALQGLPPFPRENAVAVPLTADYRPQLKAIAGLEASLGVRLVPRSQNPTDGLILRTASGPERCNDATLAQLAPVANLIVDAELARTGVTSAGVKDLMKLEKIESVNLTQTRVTPDGIAELRTKPGMKRLYLFESH
jgi:hypothetical protein